VPLHRVEPEVQPGLVLHVPTWPKYEQVESGVPTQEPEGSGSHPASVAQLPPAWLYCWQVYVGVPTQCGPVVNL